MSREAGEGGGALWGADEDDAGFDRERSDGAVEGDDAAGGASEKGRAQERRHLDGADYLSRHGLRRDGLPIAHAPSEPDAAPRSVFVSGLTWWTTDVELEALLNRFGRVESIKFVEDKSNGKSKGSATVEFATPEAAAACKEGIEGNTLHGKQPVVAYPAQGEFAGSGARPPQDVAQQRWPQQPPPWSGAGRGAPPGWAGPGPDWRGPPPGMGGPFPPWAGPGRSAPPFVRPPFAGPMGMMPGYGPMGGMMPPPGFRPPFFQPAQEGRLAEEQGRDDEGDKKAKKRHRDDDKREKSRRKERRSRSRSRSRSR